MVGEDSEEDEAEEADAEPLREDGDVLVEAAAELLVMSCKAVAGVAIAVEGDLRDAVSEGRDCDG